MVKKEKKARNSVSVSLLGAGCLGQLEYLQCYNDKSPAALPEIHSPEERKVS